MSIEAVALSLPSVVHTAESIACQSGADPSFISDKVGLQTRYVLGENEGGVSLAAQACEKLFTKYPWLRDKIKLLVFVTQSPDQRIPHNAPQLAHALSLGTDVASFDLALGCSGYVYGLDVAMGFMERIQIEHALLVTCDPYSRSIAAEDRDTNCVFGDAASATWLRLHGGRCQALSRDFGTDGGRGSAIEITHGGVLHPMVSLCTNSDSSSVESDGLRLRMRGRSVYNFVLDRIPSSLDACLNRAGFTITDVDIFVLHPGSKFMLDALVRKAGLPPERVPFNMKRMGNVVSTSIPALLADLDTERRLDGALVLMSGFGVGLSWATSLWRFESPINSLTPTFL